LMEKDLSKPRWTFKLDRSKGDFVRGTTREFSEEQARLGGDPATFPRGQVFVSDSNKIANQFAKSQAVREGGKPGATYYKTDTSKLLRYEKLSDSELDMVWKTDLRKVDKYKPFVNELNIDEGRMARDMSIPSNKGDLGYWYRAQQNLELMAREKGKAGFTKPYKTLSRQGKEYEATIWDKSGFKEVANLKPTSYAPKSGTTRTKVNIVAPSDEITSGVKGLNVNKVFGDKHFTDSYKQTLKGSSSKNELESQGFFAQAQNYVESTSGFTSKRSFEGYDFSPEQVDKILGGYRVRSGTPKPQRLTKDTVRDYFWGQRLAAQAAWKVGDKKLARQIGSTMKATYEREKEWIDWQGSIKKYRDISDVPTPKLPDTMTQSAMKKLAKEKSLYAKFGTVESSKIAAMSPSRGSSSPNSIYNGAGERSVSGFTEEPKSFKVSASTKSVTSSSVKGFSSSIRSVKSPRSVRSPRSVSAYSGKSMKSPSINSPKSPFTKSPKSPFTPSPKSPSTTSPKSPFTPSPSSPPSPGSPSSPQSPKSPSSPSPKSSGRGSPIAKILPSTKKPVPKKKPLIALLPQNRTEKKPGKKFKTHDFLGNTKTDHIVGLFRRETVIHGDKRTAKQVRMDKKVDPWGNSDGLGYNKDKKKNFSFHSGGSNFQSEPKKDPWKIKGKKKSFDLGSIKL
jgi:hypothetical protein